MVVISVSIFYIPEENIQQLESFGYFGSFLISLLSNATVFLPAPGLLVVFSLGAKFNPLLIAVTAALGASLGETSGYLAGRSSSAIISNREIYNKLIVWMKKNGELTILLMALVPNPFFDLTGIAAGMLKMPLGKFLFWAFWGKLIKMLIVAFTGAGIIATPLLTNFIP